MKKLRLSWKNFSDLVFVYYWHDSIAIVGLCGVFVFLFMQLFFPESRLFITPDFGLSEFWQYTYPVKTVLAQSLRSGILPLWRSDIATGYPLFAEGQMGYFYLYNHIAFRILPVITAINLGYIVTFSLASIGTYMFGRVHGLTVVAAFFSAVTFGLSGTMITQISHFNVIQSLSLMPWVLLSVHFLFRKRTVPRALIVSLILSQQYFIGFPQVSFITLCAVGLYYLFFVEKKLIRRDAALGMIIVISTFLLCAVQFFQSQELFLNSTRKRMLPYKTATYFSYPPKHFITLLFPYALGSPKDGSYPDFVDFDGSVFWENTGYIGIIALFLALVASVKLKKNRAIFFLVILLVSSSLLMTGKYSPLYFAYTAVPFNLFRVPSRFIMIFVWALSLLAGYGLGLVQKNIQKKLPRISVIVLIFVICISFVDQFQFAYFYNPTGSAHEWLKKPATTRFLRSRDRYYSLGIASAWNSVFKDKGWSKVEPYKFLLSGLEPNVNMLFGGNSFTMYPILPTVRQNLVANLLQSGLQESKQHISISRASQNLLALNNVDYLISTKPVSGYTRRFTVSSPTAIQDTIGLYEGSSLPYARFVYSYRGAQTVEEFKSIISSQSFDPSKNIVLEDIIELVPSDQELKNMVKTISVHHTQKLFQVKTQLKGLFTIAESFYPGWKAYIDDSPTEIYAANVNGQAIVVPAGLHTIRFQYEPDMLSAGIVVSTVSHITVLLILFGGYFFPSHRVFAILKRIGDHGNNRGH